MKILRIRLEHFRGITSREIVLQPAGVTVVEGPNEVGKSCVPEAIGLIRSYLDSSRAKAVTDVRPVGQDVGPKVELEVVTGPYHLVYTKQFLSRPSTELRILAPRPEQLAGREAHDRFDTFSPRPSTRSCGTRCRSCRVTRCASQSWPGSSPCGPHSGRLTPSRGRAVTTP
ncbi:MAG: AAA family ATPase [Nocardioidaceae bacterium]